MKQIKLNLILVLVMTFGLVFTAGVPAFAKDGADDSSTTVSSTESTTDSSGSDSTGSSSNSSNGEVEVESHLSSNAELHSKADDVIAELEKDHNKHHSAAEIEHQCESHKQGLESKFSHIVANSQRIQDRITSIYEKAVAYKTDNNVTVSNWDTLVAAADAAKAASADSITALQGVTPTLDCNNTSVATDVATFKVASQETRDNLKAYRNAIKNVIHALLDAKNADNTTTGGSN